MKKYSLLKPWWICPTKICIYMGKHFHVKKLKILNQKGKFVMWNCDEVNGFSWWKKRKTVCTVRGLGNMWGKQSSSLKKFDWLPWYQRHDWVNSMKMSSHKCDLPRWELILWMPILVGIHLLEKNIVRENRRSMTNRNSEQKFLIL